MHSDPFRVFSLIVEIVRACLVFAVESKQCEDAFKNPNVIESAHYGSTTTCDVAFQSQVGYNVLYGASYDIASRFDSYPYNNILSCLRSRETCRDSSRWRIAFVAILRARRNVKFTIYVLPSCVV